ncbi:MAG: hypothetical protein ABL308_01825 [Oceanicaulis sp.]
MPLTTRRLLTAVLAAVGTWAANTGSASAQDRGASAAAGQQASTLVVLEFETVTASAKDQSGGQDRSANSDSAQARESDPVSVPGVLARAETPQLARLKLRERPDAPTAVDGLLIFEDVSALTAWRQTRMDSFFEPMGGAGAIEMKIRLVDKALLEQYGLGGPDTPIENVSITYENTGNEADGDADIDAVTVICPGDFAECDPSN